MKKNVLWEWADSLWAALFLYRIAYFLNEQIFSACGTETYQLTLIKRRFRHG